MHKQPKNVGKKPGCPKRKAPSHYEKPEIDSYFDPLSGIMTSGNRDVSQTTILSEPRYSPPNPPSSLANSVIPTALATSSQCKQLCAIPSQPTASVSSSQIYQLNLHLQNVTSSFQCSPLPVMAASRGTKHPTVVVSQPFQVKIVMPAINFCARCRNGYARGEDGWVLPPLDLCLVHKEQHFYYNNIIVNGRQQLSSLSNVHYHAIPHAQGFVFQSLTLVLFMFLKK